MANYHECYHKSRDIFKSWSIINSKERKLEFILLPKSVFKWMGDFFLFLHAALPWIGIAVGFKLKVFPDTPVKEKQKWQYPAYCGQW